MHNFEYSKDDHYKWGWGPGDVWFNKPEPKHAYGRVQLGSCTRPHQGFRQECINTAEYLGGKFTKPTLIGLSGGFDSQVVCLSFINAKVPFRPVILRLLSSSGEVYNTHDIEGAFEFCRKNNLDPLVETLDLDKFYKTKAISLIREHNLGKSRTIVQLYLVDKYGADHSYIMGGGDMVLYPSTLYDDDTLIWLHGSTPIQQHLIKYRYEGVTKFFMYSPELIHSYIDNVTIKNFINAKTAIYDAFKRMKGIGPNSWWQCFSFFIKPMFYVEQFPELVQRRKYTGFEKAKIIDSVDDVVSVINREYKLTEKKIIVPLDEISDHLANGCGAPKVWKSNYRELKAASDVRNANKESKTIERFERW